MLLVRRPRATWPTIDHRGRSDPAPANRQRAEHRISIPGDHGAACQHAPSPGDPPRDRARRDSRLDQRAVDRSGPPASQKISVASWLKWPTHPHQYRDGTQPPCSDPGAPGPRDCRCLGRRAAGHRSAPRLRAQCRAHRPCGASPTPNHDRSHRPYTPPDGLGKKEKSAVPPALRS